MYIIRDAPFDIWGGGARNFFFKKFVATKVRKKSLLKMWAEKKFVVEFAEKYVDQ